MKPSITFRMPKLNYYIRKHFRPKVLILDLDDTVLLWPRRLKLVSGKHLNFSAYVGNVFAKITSEVLEIERDDAYELCLTGFQDYGSAIIGLMASEDYDVSFAQAEEIFLKVHKQVATNPSKGLVAWAKPNIQLYNLLKQLRTKPYIFTHGSTEYAKIALKTMGLLNTVIPEENVFGMDMYGYYNTKNKPAAYAWLQQRLNIPFNRMVMSEDSHKNLYWAYAAGMKTVLLHRPDAKGDPFPDYLFVDHTHQSLEDYLSMFLDKGVNYTKEKLDRALAELLYENQPFCIRHTQDVYTRYLTP
jgi:FMN phosphatase YigB (HAD superfamily)